MNPQNTLFETLPQDRPLLVYDGDCGFCNRSVQFILSHERRRRDLLFVPRASDLGRTIRQHFGLEAVESMLWIDNGSAKIESEAALRAAAYVGGWSRAAVLAYMIPRPLRNWAYRVIAKNRHQISGTPRKCVVLTEEQKPRFLG